MLEQARRHAEGLRLKTAVPPAADADDPARRADELDRRTYLRDDVGDEVEIRQILFEAVERGDRITFDAVRNAPRYMGLASDETVQKAEEMWAEKTDPDNLAVLRELDDAIGKVEQLRDTAVTEIKRDAGLVDDATPIIIGEAG